VTAGRVLVLDGQTTQALVSVRSLGRAGYTVFVASPRRRPLAAWSRYCRAQFWVHEETVEGFAALRAWAREQGVQVVLPQRERSCVLCNMEREQWEALGIAVGCGPQDMLAQAFDKARTIEHAVACGVRIPPTRLPTSLAECHVAAEAVGYPCIIKPRFSDFWDGRRFLQDRGPQFAHNAVELEANAVACRQGALWPVIQGLVPGRGKGVFALCDRGEPVVWFGHERLRDIRPSGSGSSLRRSIPLDARTQEPALRLLTGMAWHGPAMIEFRDDGTGEPCLIEVNGRFWGSLSLAVACGVDFPTLWVRLLCGEPVGPVANYQTGVTLRWLWGDVKRLLHIMAGAPPGFPDPYPTVLTGLREVLGAQPSGTRSETWSADDRWPAVAEWIQASGELSGLVRTAVRRWLSGPAASHPAATRPAAPPMPTPQPVEAMHV
jgi:predicted ATP-grasp superfamily ATP-dependent carboligase